MKSKELNIQKTSTKSIALKVYQQDLEVRGINKNSLFTSSSRHKHQRKKWYD